MSQKIWQQIHNIKIIQKRYPSLMKTQSHKTQTAVAGKLSGRASTIYSLQKQQQTGILPSWREMQAEQNEMCKGTASLGHLSGGRKAD